MIGASMLRAMLATSVACFYLAAGLFDDRGKYASCFACSNLTHLDVLCLLFLQQFAAIFIACLCAPCIPAWGA